MMEAESRKIDGPPGFFLAMELDDAIFFGGQRDGTIIEIDFSEHALALLEAAGMVRQPIPRSPKSPRFVGEEMVIGPGLFALFNQLRESGETRSLLGAHEMKTIDPLDHIRKHPELYLGGGRSDGPSRGSACF